MKRKKSPVFAAILMLVLLIQGMGWTARAEQENQKEMDTLEDGVENEEPPVLAEESVGNGKVSFGAEGGVENEDVAFESEDAGDMRAPGENSGEEKEGESLLEEEASEQQAFLSEEKAEEGGNILEGISQEIVEFTDADETEEGPLLYATPENFIQEGNPVKDGANGFLPVNLGENYYSSKYVRLGWNKDSAVIPWNNAGSDVLMGQRNGTGLPGIYFLPQNENAKGKFGFRVTNVGFNQEANTKVDLLLTCTDYENYTYDHKGNRMDDIYPMVGMATEYTIWIFFKSEMPVFELKIDIVESGTTNPVTGNYRFRWLDIDNYQRFGFLMQNGSMAAKYATKDSVVNASSWNLFGKNYEILTAPEPEVEGESPQNTVVYEIDNSSGIWLSILTAGWQSHSTGSSGYINRIYEELKSGSTPGSAGLNWDAKGYGPMEYPKLIKAAGNDSVSLETSNRLDSVDAEYYYTLRTDIPEEQPDYYYSQCDIQDTLPAGVDYNGYVSVKCLSDGKDVSSCFTVLAQEDVISFRASAAAMADSGFYGKTYEFKIGVKLDPMEISPDYEGNTCIYTVQNRASITCRHQTDTAGVNWSNEVVTICQENRPEPDNPIKWIADGDEKKTSREYTNREFEAVFGIDQVIPSYRKEWEITNVHLEDTLEECFEFQGARIFLDQTELAEFGSSGGTANGWQVSLEGQKVRASVQGDFLSRYYGKELSLEIMVRAKDGESLSSYYVKNENPEIIESRIPNEASSWFEWAKGSPSSDIKHSETAWIIVKETVPKGKIAIKKTTEDGTALSGAVYQVTAREDILSPVGKVLLKAGEKAETLTTGEDGCVLTKDLYVGKYRIQEIRPPQGYTLNTVPADVEISYEAGQKSGTVEQASFVNEETLVYLKKVSCLAEGEKEQQVLAGAVFWVWDKSLTPGDGKAYTTDENGLARIKGLKPGTYCYQETDAPSGYVPDDKVREFTVDENGQVEKEQGHIILVENRFISAEFSKIDKADRHLVPGARLQLTDSAGKVVDTWVSEEKPHRINRIAAGVYTLTELQPPEGYKKSEAVQCVVTAVPELQSYQMEDVKYVTVTLEKVIHASEIVWAHGNPVFTFRVEGMDLEGCHLVCYDTVEFVPENAGTDGDVKLTACFQVPAGRYQASELKTARYALEEIRGVVNGTVSDGTVNFDLSGNQDGTAVFVNKKVSDQNLTDTCFVRNTIIPSE